MYVACCRIVTWESDLTFLLDAELRRPARNWTDDTVGRQPDSQNTSWKRISRTTNVASCTPQHRHASCDCCTSIPTSPAVMMAQLQGVLLVRQPFRVSDVCNTNERNSRLPPPPPKKVARNGVEKLRFVLFNDLLVYGQAKRRRGLGRGLLR